MTMRLARLAAVLLVALASGLRAEEPPEPTFADKPASWWVDEMLAGDQAAAARSVLEKMGREAALPVARRISDVRGWRDRERLLELLSKQVARDQELARTVLPHVRPCLQSDHAREVTAALDLVARAGTGEDGLAAQVAALVRHRFSSIRGRAARALGTMGADAAPYAASLVTLLELARLPETPERDRDRDRYAAIEACGALGPHARAALPALLVEVERSPTDLRLVLAVARVAPDDERATAAVAAAFASGSDDIRGLRRAVDALEAGPHLLAIARIMAVHDVPEIRGLGAVSLGRCGAETGAIPPELLTLLRDSDGSVVMYAASGIEMVGAVTDEELVSVGAALRATRHPARFRKLLGALRPEIGPQLIETALAGEGGCSHVAFDVLQSWRGEMFGMGSDRILALLLDPRFDLSRRVLLLRRLEASTSLANDEGHDLCATLVQEGEADLAVEALNSLFGDGKRRGVIVGGLERPEPEVRSAALHALAQLVDRHEDVRDAVSKLFRDADAAVAGLAFQSVANTFRATPPHLPVTPSPWREQLVSALPHFLEGDNEWARDAAFRVLMSLRPEERSSDLLFGLLGDERYAMQTVGFLVQATNDVDARLTELVGGDDPLLAARAAQICIRRKHPLDELLPVVRAGLASKNANVVRESVVAAYYLDDRTLAQIGGELLYIVRSRSQMNAVRACGVLVRLKEYSPEITELLLAIAGDPEHPAHPGIAMSLPRLGERGEKALLGLLDSPVRDARRNTAVQYLQRVLNGGTLDDTIRAALREMAKGDDLELAGIAKQALEGKPIPGQR